MALKIYIPHTDYPVVDKRELFILTRPFFNEEKWQGESLFQGQPEPTINRTLNIADADVVLLPFSVNFYAQKGKISELAAINAECLRLHKKAYTFISGDFGVAYPEFSEIYYFRMGGFRSQLSNHNLGFPVSLSDHFQRIFQEQSITPVRKKELPVIGFCGHATFSTSKKWKEIAKCIRENARRFLQNPFRKDWEPLFASAYERAGLLRSFEKHSLIQTNFVYRDHYRGGAVTEAQRTQTTLEYYNNIRDSDYIVCVRGAGNFSVRFYETLMMGKIPIFVNTDCLLPFSATIDWKKHVIWIAWKDRKNIAQQVSDFHKSLSEEDFIRLQLDNRNLWKETLSVKGMLEMLMD